MNNLKSKKIFIYLTIFVLIIITIIGFYILNKDKTAELTILVAPSSSIIKIGDNNYHNGTIKIKPGKYNVIISKEGFTSYKSTINITNDSTNKLYKAIFQTDGTYSWYIKHQDDDKLLTIIGDNNSVKVQNKLADEYPLLKYIPYTKQSNGILYKIDAQMNENRLESIKVFFNTCSDYSINIYKTDVLNWIKSKGLNPEDYNIIYSSLCN